MIERVMNLNYFTYGKPFTGSLYNGGFCYRIIAPKDDDIDRRFIAACWKGPFAYDKTKEEIRTREFEFSEKGYDELIGWLDKESTRYAGES